MDLADCVLWRLRRGVFARTIEDTSANNLNLGGECMDATAVLQQTFGYQQFRPGQEEIINHVLAGDNTLAIMPTGGGKSLCYQIPALMLPGLTLVISPLISLMKDQVDAANELGISAAFINSSLDFFGMLDVLKEAQAGRLKLLYVAPERFDSPDFMAALQKIKISLIAVDEAHCISQWGHDFRPSYLGLSEVLADLTQQPPVIALTATATPQVAQDICQRLNIPENNEIKTGFGRQNLAFSVIKDQSGDDYLLRYLKANPDQSGIIYCSTRKEVERVGALLTRRKIANTIYHGGLNENQRRQHQEDFVYDRVSIMVATNAFGMGIDKSNVRFVIHDQVPGSLEAYYQEAGRAGRDGLPSEAILLYSPQDVLIQHFFIDQSELSDQLKQVEYRKLQEMTAYANTQSCLQQFIQRYFGEVAEPCGRCSNCLDDRETVEITIDAQKVLSCVKRMGERYGKGLIAQVLTGAHNQRVIESHFDELSTYGLLGTHSQKAVSQLIDFLTASGYLLPSAGQYPTLSVTATGVEVLKGQRQVYRKVDRVVKSNQSITVADEGLFAELRALRRELAESEHVPPFVIFSDKTLIAMAELKPSTETEFLAVKGVGENKMTKYGAKFRQVIADYTAKKEIAEV